jgi:hypothetical protein
VRIELGDAREQCLRHLYGGQLPRLNAATDLDEIKKT